MTRFIPGSVVLYREPGTSLPLWPAILCTDEVAPRWFLQTRPSGYVALVLRLVRVLDASQLRWATTTDLNEFDPCAAEHMIDQSIPGLANAYEVALSALLSGLKLDHWKSALATNTDHDTIVIDSDDDEESSNDAEMRLAIQRSLEDVRPQEAQHVSKSSASHAKRSNAWPEQLPPRVREFMPHPYGDQLFLPVRRRTQKSPRLQSLARSTASSSSLSPKRLTPLSSNYSDNELTSPPRKRRLSGMTKFSRRNDSYNFSAQSANCTSPMFAFSDEDDLPPPPRRPESSAATRFRSSRPPQQSVSRHKSAARTDLSVEQLFLRNGLGTPASAVPNDDTIEEDLDESSQFVQVFIGPEVDPATDRNVDPQRCRHKLQLLKHHVWERPYFRDALSGRNYFNPIGENTWELMHPRLVDVSPEDFRMVAEFLSDGDFGIRNPQDAEQVAEIFAECMSAWKTAELLSMDDLLEHIVEKIRAARPWWDLWNVMAFACSIYQSDVALQAHDDMEAMLSDAIAEMYDIYVEDDYLRAPFITRLKQLPRLKRDVHARIVVQVDRRLQPRDEDEDGEAPQDGQMENDENLYI